MSFERNAQKLTARIRKGTRGFMSLTREELRDAFEIGRLTEGQSEAIVQALLECQMMIHPHPSGAMIMRVYDLDHDMGGVARAVLDPDAMTDGPLRRAADALHRCHLNEEIRAEELPWIEAFDILLQVVLGHGISGWEDIRSGRHGRLLAHELAQALGLPPDIGEKDWFIGLAGALRSVRPSSQVRSAIALCPGSKSENIEMAEQLRTHIILHQQRCAAEHREALAAAARIALDGRELPKVQVEMGILGLRKRIAAE